MYSLKQIFAKVIVGGARWIEQDLQAALDVDVRDIASVYGQTRMVLEHSHEPGVLHLFDFPKESAPFINRFTGIMTLGEWFIALANTALPTTPFTKVTTVKANFADALEAGFKVEAVIPGALFNQSVPWSERTDLLMTHPKLSAKLVEENVLVSVNGYLHRTYSSEAGVYVMQGGRTMTVSDENTVGVISLANLGGCKIIPIVESMIGGLPEEGTVLETPIYLNVPDVDWDTHTAALVLCGHLINLGDVFRSTGGPSFELNLMRYPYLENFLKAESYLDLKQVRSMVSNKPGAPSMISVREARGRAFLKELLTISQSFVVAIKSPDVYIDKVPLETTQHPGCFFHHEPVTSPAVFHDGKLMNYIQDIQRDTSVLYVSKGIHDKLRMHANQWHHQNAVDIVRTNLRRVEPGNCSVLHIKRDVFI